MVHRERAGRLLQAAQAVVQPGVSVQDAADRPWLAEEHRVQVVLQDTIAAVADMEERRDHWVTVERDHSRAIPTGQAAAVAAAITAAAAGQPVAAAEAVAAGHLTQAELPAVR